jgi:hypothetical protein
MNIKATYSIIALMFGSVIVSVEHGNHGLEITELPKDVFVAAKQYSAILNEQSVTVSTDRRDRQVAVSVRFSKDHPILFTQISRSDSIESVIDLNLDGVADVRQVIKIDLNHGPEEPSVSIRLNNEWFEVASCELHEKSAAVSKDGEVFQFIEGMWSRRE